jgi:hypothetical protein
MLAVTFGIWYGSVRIVTDFLRVDKRFFGLTGSQWASVLVVAICLATLVRWARRPLPGGTGVLAAPPDGREAEDSLDADDSEDEDDEDAFDGEKDEPPDRAEGEPPDHAEGEPTDGLPTQPEDAPTA